MTSSAFPRFESHEADFRVLADEILQIMRNYKTDLQNAASTAAYRRA
jgi:hypothetical protein